MKEKYINYVFENQYVSGKYQKNEIEVELEEFLRQLRKNGIIEEEK